MRKLEPRAESEGHVHPRREIWLLGTVGCETAERQHVHCTQSSDGRSDEPRDTGSGPGVSHGEGPGDGLGRDQGLPGDSQQRVHQRRGPGHGEAGVRGRGRGLVPPGDGQ